MAGLPLVEETCQRIHLVSSFFLQTDHNGNKLKFIGQLFTTMEEDDHAVNGGFLLTRN